MCADPRFQGSKAPRLNNLDLDIYIYKKNTFQDESPSDVPAR